MGWMSVTTTSCPVLHWENWHWSCHTFENSCRNFSELILWQQRSFGCQTVSFHTLASDAQLYRTAAADEVSVVNNINYGNLSLIIENVPHDLLSPPPREKVISQQKHLCTCHNKWAKEMKKMSNEENTLIRQCAVNKAGNLWLRHQIIHTTE